MSRPAECPLPRYSLSRRTAIRRPAVPAIIITAPTQPTIKLIISSTPLVWLDNAGQNDRFMSSPALRSGNDAGMQIRCRP